MIIPINYCNEFREPIGYPIGIDNDGFLVGVNGQRKYYTPNEYGFTRSS